MTNFCSRKFTLFYDALVILVWITHWLNSTFVGQWKITNYCRNIVEVSIDGVLSSSLISLVSYATAAFFLLFVPSVYLWVQDPPTRRSQKHCTKVRPQEYLLKLGNGVMYHKYRSIKNKHFIKTPLFLNYLVWIILFYFQLLGSNKTLNPAIYWFT